METKDIVKEAIEKAVTIQHLHTLEVMDLCLDAIDKTNVTIKYEDSDTHIYIGGKYFNTMKSTQWAKVVNLVIDVTGKAYVQGACDYSKDLVEKLKSTK